MNANKLLTDKESNLKVFANTEKKVVRFPKKLKNI
jgi:hypothetical protein